MGNLRRLREVLGSCVDLHRLGRKTDLEVGWGLGRRRARPTRGREGELGCDERRAGGAEREGRTFGERRRALLHDDREPLTNRSLVHSM